MPTTLNRTTMIKLWQEDLEWLLKQPRTLERDHIECMLNIAITNCQKQHSTNPPHDCNICGGIVTTNYNQP